MLRRVRARRDRDESGAVAIIFALLSLVLLLLAGMVVDLGLARDTARRSQNSADASALAAANAMYTSAGVPNIAAAVSAAKSYATANYGVAAGDWAGCTDSDHLAYLPDSGNECISLDEAGQPRKVRVRMPSRDVQTTFGVLAGVQRISISRSAGASIDNTGKQPCGLCLLGNVTHDFQNGDVVVSGGDIYINGSASVNSNGLVSTNGHIYVQNTASGPLSSYQPDPTTNVPALPDPLANLTLPPDMSMLTSATKSDPCTQGPGIYTGQNLNNKVCTLTPGLYVIRGGTWDGSGTTGGTLQGNGVTLYFTCSNSAGTAPQACADAGQSGGALDASGSYLLNMQAQLTTPTTNGAIQGLTIVYDRNNTSQLRMTGNGASGFVGAIYAKRSTLQINGNGCSTTYNSMIVTGDISMSGNNSCLTASYSVAQNPAPAPGNVRLFQ